MHIDSIFGLPIVGIIKDLFVICLKDIPCACHQCGRLFGSCSLRWLILGISFRFFLWYLCRHGNIDILRKIHYYYTSVLRLGFLFYFSNGDKFRKQPSGFIYSTSKLGGEFGTCSHNFPYATLILLVIEFNDTG